MKWRSAAFLAAAGLALPAGFVIADKAPAKGEPARPVNNDCSGGHIELTFDDGPGVHTRELLDRLNALHLHATFFVIGKNIEDGGRKAVTLMHDLVAAGNSVQNHTYDHASITGESTKRAPLTAEQITQELDGATRTIVAAGLPRPTLYRPPYGDIDARADDLARKLGYRIVSPWGITDSNIVDSKDWSGATTEQIVSNVVNGYTSDGYRLTGIRDRTIVTMHDGGRQDTLNSIAALQPIVDYMNAHRLCSTTAIREDATGGRVPTPPLPEPGAGNLVHNASLEKRHGAEPACFQHAENDTAGVPARWSRVAGRQSGSTAEQLVVERSTGGDRKLIIARDPAGSPCLSKVTPGIRYGTWLWYKGDWPDRTDVSIVVYYRRHSGDWEYWANGPSVEASPEWTLTDFVTAPLPSEATAISFGLEISGTGTIVTDDYAMAPQ
ncbi:polysaccharide deacetylase family protein [Actinoplanes sp. CA-030573]|uniref:polysaccharide deacetylase family protein n=1 Tax=Actinoplanes sp. CA-030573 TaxID=3239898 RepID=UPI003D89EDCC